MWYIIAAIIAVCWGTYLRATGHSWAGAILRPVIGICTFALAITFYAVMFIILALFVLIRLVRGAM